MPILKGGKPYPANSLDLVNYDISLLSQQENSNIFKNVALYQQNDEEKHQKISCEKHKMPEMWVSDDQIIFASEQKTVLDPHRLVLPGMRQDPQQNTVNIVPTFRTKYYNFQIYDPYKELFLLPGLGRKPANCIGWVPIKVCGHYNCKYIHFAKGNCRSPYCPDCHVKWRYRRAQSLFERIWSHKMQHKSRSGHIVISPPESEYASLKNFDDFSSMFKKAYTLAKDHGVLGGAIVFHPFRLKKGKKHLQLVKEAKQKLGWEKGKFGLWKALVTLHRDDWRDFVVFSPHYHILGNYYYIKPGGQESDEGWVIKRIGDHKLPIDNVKNSMYLLSHIGLSLFEHHNNIRWFGKLSTASWSLFKADLRIRDFIDKNVADIFTAVSKQYDNGEEKFRCPICNTQLIDLQDLNHYVTSFSEEKKQILRFCYEWFSGIKPPPDDISGFMKDHSA